MGFKASFEGPMSFYPILIANEKSLWMVTGVRTPTPCRQILYRLTLFTMKDCMNVLLLSVIPQCGFVPVSNSCLQLFVYNYQELGLAIVRVNTLVLRLLAVQVNMLLHCSYVFHQMIGKLMVDSFKTKIGIQTLNMSLIPVNL